eukprot:jgi/Mesvir1/22386/Mv17877-RA.2
MFYFFFESRGDKDRDPLVLWMTGGPGCSSELAVYMENGPWVINEDLTLNLTQYGWDTAANMIFVDQPINTGFSYSDDPRDLVHNEKGVADDMWDFLQEFLAAHPSLADRPFFVTGESYAGHYVPAVSYRIMKGNEKLDEAAAAAAAAKAAASGDADVVVDASAVEGVREDDGHIRWKKINLQGLAIGNGLTDPAIQYGAYADFSYENKLIDKATYDMISQLYPACNASIQQCYSGTGGLKSRIACLSALGRCEGIVDGILMAAGNINVYDIREQCNVKPLCYNMTLMTKYLNAPETRELLGVGHRVWKSCSNLVHSAMMADWMSDWEPVIPPMLEAGLRVMIYAGEADFICNWLGNHRWVEAMPWSGQKGFNDAPMVPWNGGDAGKAEGGYYKAFENLSFVKVAQAGHMVPYNQPKHSLVMLKAFLAGKPLSHQGPEVEEEKKEESPSERGQWVDVLRLAQEEVRNHFKGKAAL